MSADRMDGRDGVSKSRVMSQITIEMLITPFYRQPVLMNTGPKSFYANFIPKNTTMTKGRNKNQLHFHVISNVSILLQ